MMSLVEESFTSFILIAVCACASVAAFKKAYSHLNLPVPPGPPLAGWLSGHAAILPPTKPWKTYAEWADKYGPVVHLRAYHQRIILISSIEDCNEIFEKRSNLYSDRPTFPMADLMGWEFNSSIMPYGPRWRKQRRLFHQMFRKEASLAYRPEQTRKVNDMLYGLLTSPEDFRDHVSTLSASIVMSSAYAYDIQPKKDHFVHIAEEAIMRIAEAVLPGARLVNHIPILQYIPAWFPGAGFHKYAADGKVLVKQMKELPFKWTQEKLNAGETLDCIVADRLPSCRTEEDVVALQEFAAMTYAAGADTTTGPLNTLFYAMAAVSPEVQKKAQSEIDKVVGRDRLPSYEDWESLPYIEAIMRELLRWRPVLPLGVPHRVTDDDIYKGYLIPKGSFVISNIWALSRNASVYKDPEAFNPDRYFDENGQLNDDDLEYAFGFGRRKCPGRHMARASVWLSVATILWGFDIRKAKDASGADVPIKGEYSDGLISHSLPYKCSITPRFAGVEAVIRDAVAQTKERMLR